MPTERKRRKMVLKGKKGSSVVVLIPGRREGRRKTVESSWGVDWRGGGRCLERREVPDYSEEGNILACISVALGGRRGKKEGSLPSSFKYLGIKRKAVLGPGTFSGKERGIGRNLGKKKGGSKVLRLRARLRGAKRTSFLFIGEKMEPFIPGGRRGERRRLIDHIGREGKGISVLLFLSIPPGKERKKGKGLLTPLAHKKESGLEAFGRGGGGGKERRTREGKKRKARCDLYVVSRDKRKRKPSCLR